MNRPARLVASPAKALFTTAEFLRMGAIGAFDDMRVELVHGEIERMPPPMSNHAATQAMIVGLLWPLAKVNALYVLSEVGIDMGNDTVFACDAALLSEPIDGNRLVSPQELILVIEVAETSLSRDLGPKCEEYAAAAVANYWVVDAAAGMVHVRAEPENGRYTRASAVRFGEPLPVPGTDASITLD